MQRHGFEIEEVDFTKDLDGIIVKRAICKDCGNGDNIIAPVYQDCTGYATIDMACKIHTPPLTCGGNMGGLLDLT